MIGIMPKPRGGIFLNDDIAELGRSGVRNIVSLLTPHEAKILELEKEQEHCEANGITYTSFPVTDFGIPGDTAAALNLVEKMFIQIKANRKVIVHCRGGIGRSSLIAGALLVREGLSAEKAFEAITAVRGVKVPETPSQAAWLKTAEATLHRKKAS
jgi:protein-tyrosine phosphatase